MIPVTMRNALTHATLSAEEELELAWKYKLHNDLEAAEKLVLSNLRLVMKIVNDFRGYNLPEEDMFQEGVVGLMRAVKKFDPSKGFRLATYATHFITERVMEFIKHNLRIVRNATGKAQTKLFWKQAVVSDNTPEEAAKIIGVSVEEVNRFKANRGSDIPLESSVSDCDGEYSVGLIDTLSDGVSTEDIVVEGTHQVQLSEKLTEAMSTLDTRRKKILMDRIMSEDPKTLDELACELNLSKERVRQLEAEAIDKLRKFMTVDKMVYKG